MSNTRNILPNNPDRALREMIKIIEALDNVYSRETDALNASDAKTFMALQNEKISCTNIYQTAMTELIQRKPELKNAAPNLKNKIRSMQEKFSIMTEQNLKALERMKRLTHRLGDTIHKATRDSIEKKQGRRYSATGQLYESARKSVSMGVSETA